MSKERELLNALQRFEKRITLNAVGSPSIILERAIAQNVKIAYYLNSVSMSTVMGTRHTYDVQYHNTEVSPNDVCVVCTDDEVQNVLCQYIGNYKARLVLFAKPSVRVEDEYRKFGVVNAPFYSNYVGSQIMRYEVLHCPMFCYDFCFNYRIGKVKLAMMERETDAEVERIAKQLFLPGMTDATKAFLAHNYLAHAVEYTLKENATNLETSYMQSAYGALIKKKCVCQGYAEAFKRLMDFAGIECDIVCGKTDASSTYHAWNVVKLNGERDNFHIDVTWDSAGEKVSYTYFGLKDADLAGKRTWNKEYNATCNSSMNLLLEARRGIMRFKSQLLANGASIDILGY